MTVKKMISYRSVWMGLAIIWIMLFHSQISLPFPLNWLLHIGYGGVDIFLFASGIGNYYSYLKDETPLKFLKRRLYRLAPSYIPIILLWCLYYVSYKEISIWAIIGNLFGVQYLSSSGIAFNWFFAGLLICYLLTPYLAKFVQTHKLFINILLVLVLVIISLCFITDENLIIVMTRLPIYTIGMIFAKHEDTNIRKRAVFFVGGFVIGNLLLFLSYRFLDEYLWSYGLHWYPFILITPGACWIISELSALCDKCFLSVLIRFAKFLGTFTFEMFLVYFFILYLLNGQLEKMSYPNLLSSGVLVISIVFAFVYRLLVRLVIKTIKNSRNRQSVPKTK